MHPLGLGFVLSSLYLYRGKFDPTVTNPWPSQRINYALHYFFDSNCAILHQSQRKTSIISHYFDLLRRSLSQSQTKGTMENCLIWLCEDYLLTKSKSLSKWIPYVWLYRDVSFWKSKVFPFNSIRVWLCWRFIILESNLKKIVTPPWLGVNSKEYNDLSEQ